MSKVTSSSSSGVSVVGLLGVAFIVLKLCKVIDWSWWWVLAPFWIPGGLIVLLLFVLGIIAVACVITDRREANREKPQADD